MGEDVRRDPERPDQGRQDEKSKRRARGEKEGARKRKQHDGVPQIGLQHQKGRRHERNGDDRDHVSGPEGGRPFVARKELRHHEERRQLCQLDGLKRDARSGNDEPALRAIGPHTDGLGENEQSHRDPPSRERHPPPARKGKPEGHGGAHDAAGDPLEVAHEERGHRAPLREGRRDAVDHHNADSREDCRG